MADEVLELSFNSVDDINNAINYSAPAPPDERLSQRNWQIWSIAQSTRIDSGYPAVYKWFSGESVPSTSLGVNGDLYIRSNGQLYKKNNGTWSVVTDIKGATGEPGTAATVAVGTVTSGENAAVTNSGDNNNAVFNFVIPKGDTGAAAGFGTPTATIQALDPDASPTVDIGSSGTDTSKVFTFAFGIPKGEQGDPGEGNNWYVGSYITGTSTEPKAYNTGISNAKVGDLYLNNGTLPDTGRVYVCTQGGSQAGALWKYSCIIRGADGSGTGDMTKATYDTNADGIVDDAEKLGGNAPSWYQRSTEGLTAETAVDDADYFPFYDTSATANKKTLWSNVKAKIKAYLDTIYTAALLKLTGYSKAAASAAIEETDSINTAVGKLERALDGKEASGTAAAAISAHNLSDAAHAALLGAKQDKITLVGLLKGSTEGITAAKAGTDYQMPLKAGTDYQTPLTAGADYQTPLVAGSDYATPTQLGDYLSLTGGTLTGGINLNGYSEGVEALTGTQISPANANNFAKTISANTAFTISTAGMVTGRCYAVTLVLTMGATAYTVTWPSITWADGAPAPEANTVTEVIIRTYDGGATWYGSVGGVFNVGA